MNQFPTSFKYPIGPFRFFTNICGDLRNFIFITGVKDTGDTLLTSVNYTSDKLFTGDTFIAIVVDTDDY
jgi:hypothetical protein